MPIAKKLSGRGKSRSFRAKKGPNTEDTSGDPGTHEKQDKQPKVNTHNAELSRDEAPPPPRKKKVWLTPAQLEAYVSSAASSTFLS